MKSLTRNHIGQLKRAKRNRNFRRLHLQCAVTSGGARTNKEEKLLRSKLRRLFKLENLTSRRYTRLVEKHRRKVA